MTLPPLPAPHATSFYANPLFTDDQMRAYGKACAAEERERLRDLLRLVADEPNIDKALALADAEADPVARHLAAIARHREALRDLANAADAVGVRYFDSDDPSDEVQAMQAATINAREVLRA